VKNVKENSSIPYPRWGWICPPNRISDTENDWSPDNDLGRRKPSIFMKPVKSSQGRYETSTWSPMLDRGKRDIYIAHRGIKREYRIIKGQFIIL
jgi:hypothetical protein